MLDCDLCGSLVIGGECTNLHCESTKLKRFRDDKRKVKRLKTSRKNNNKKLKVNSNQYPQDNGEILIPPNIHLKREDSLPKFFGYNTGKKTSIELRRAALKRLFEAQLVSSKDAKNSNSIAEFGTPSSETRKWKMITWFEGRIERSNTPRLKNSQRKLIDDRDYIKQSF